MPELVQIPELPQVFFDNEPLPSVSKILDNAQALTLVNSTFNEYKAYRQNNIEPLYNQADALYFGVREQRMWEGTKVPRSSIPWPIAFEHCEIASAQIYEALFSEPDWFTVEADAGAVPEEARQMQQVLRYYLDHDRDNFGISAISETHQAIKNLLVYGNGALALEWDGERKRPIWSFVDIRDLYLDPQAKSPVVDLSRSLIRRSMLTIEEIKNWGNIPGANLPSDDELFTLSGYADVSGVIVKDNQDAMRGMLPVSARSFTEFTPHKMIEVLSYWSTTRHVIVLGGRHVFLSVENPYKFIPFTIAPYCIVPGKIMGYSLPQAIGKNQMYMEALLNGRLDEIALALNPPRIAKAGANITPTARMFNPGMTMAVNNPKEDVVFQQPQGITNTALQEIEMIEVMSEKISGINSHMAGMPRPGNANRTASGMTQQYQAGQLRIMMTVRNIEDFLLTPALYKTIKMIQYHLQGGDLNALDEKGEITQVNGEIVHKPCKFKIYASNRMLSREQIMNVFPFIMQYVSNGAFLQALTQQGKTVNFNELFDMLSEATRLGKSWNLLRDLTPEEQQSLSQPPPEAQLQAAQKDKELQAKMQIEQMKAEASSNPQMKQMELEIEMRKAEMEMAQKQQEAELKKQIAQMQIQQKAMEMQLKQFEAQLKLQTSAQESELKLQTTAQSAQMDAVMKEQQHAQAMQQQADTHASQQQQAAEIHEREVAHADEAGKQKLALDKETSKAKIQSMRLAKPNPKAQKEK